jgi:hypothetical protein
VYGLYQSYPRELWGPAQPAVEHDLDVWDLLRRLLVERAQGRIDLPIVQHYGFDVLELDLDVVRALDGHLLCNKQKLAYWWAPVAAGGLGIDAFGDPSLVTFLDGDRPKAEFMNDRFSERLSDRDHEIHTVCIGRPVHIDLLAAAQQGIHVHIYGNNFDEVYQFLADDLTLREMRRHRALLQHYLHVHGSLQTIGGSRSEIWRTKSRWVEEFSQYDAGWSYIGTPFTWAPLDERGAIPNRLATYLLAGLPVITDSKRGHFRYDLLEEIGVEVELGDVDYEGLRTQLVAEIESRAKTARARAARRRYSFDAGIPMLMGALEKARERYFARPHLERIRFEGHVERAALGLQEIRRRTRRPNLSPRTLLSSLRKKLRLGLRNRWRRHRWNPRRRKVSCLAAIVQPEQAVVAVPAPASALVTPKRRVAALERFAEKSRRCEILAEEDGIEIIPFELHRIDISEGSGPLAFLAAAVRLLPELIRLRRPLLGLRACLSARDVRLGALCAVPEVIRGVRNGEIDELACFSTKGFDVVPLLAEELNVPFTEILANRTQYFGEFAFEMMAVVPYAYWLHKQGRLERTVACEDTRCLYYFSENHQERPGSRSYIPITEYPVGEIGKKRFDKGSFPVRLDTSRWAPPPYMERFRDERFLWDRPTCVVCNKMSEENYLGSPRVNSIETDLLLELVGRLRTRYQIVYNRPRSADIVNDHQRVGETGDIEALQKRHPDVLTIQELHAQYPEFSFNELQLRVFSGCRRFISVIGGSAYLASWFGGTNIIYARAGWELESGALESWFTAFSKAKVIAVSSPEELLAAVDREFMGEVQPESPPPSPSLLNRGNSGD